jgi:hypothetical protein
MTKSTRSKVPFAPQPEYDVVWSGTTISKWGEKGSLLPPSHDVGSTWNASVNRLKMALNAVNKRHVDGG